MSSSLLHDAVAKLAALDAKEQHLGVLELLSLLPADTADRSFNYPQLDTAWCALRDAIAAALPPKLLLRSLKTVSNLDDRQYLAQVLKSIAALCTSPSFARRLRPGLPMLLDLMRGEAPERHVEVREFAVQIFSKMIEAGANLGFVSLYDAIDPLASIMLSCLAVRGTEASDLYKSLLVSALDTVSDILLHWRSWADESARNASELNAQQACADLVASLSGQLGEALAGTLAFSRDLAASNKAAQSLASLLDAIEDEAPRLGANLPPLSEGFVASIQRGLLRVLAHNEDDAVDGMPSTSETAQRQIPALRLAAALMRQFGSAWLVGGGPGTGSSPAAGSAGGGAVAPLAPGVFLLTFARLLGVVIKSTTDDIEAMVLLDATATPMAAPKTEPATGNKPPDGGPTAGSADDNRKSISQLLSEIHVTPLTRAQRMGLFRSSFDAQSRALMTAVGAYTALVHEIGDAFSDFEAGGDAQSAAARLVGSLSQDHLLSLHQSLGQTAGVLLEFVATAWHSDLRPVIEGGQPAWTGAIAAYRAAANAAPNSTSVTMSSEGQPPASVQAAADDAEVASLPIRVLAVCPLLAAAGAGAAAYLQEDPSAHRVELAVALRCLLRLGAAQTRLLSAEEIHARVSAPSASASDGSGATSFGAWACLSDPLAPLLPVLACLLPPASNVASVGRATLRREVDAVLEEEEDAEEDASGADAAGGDAAGNAKPSPPQQQRQQQDGGGINAAPEEDPMAPVLLTRVLAWLLEACRGITGGGGSRSAVIPQAVAVGTDQAAAVAATLLASGVQPEFTGLGATPVLKTAFKGARDVFVAASAVLRKRGGRHSEDFAECAAALDALCAVPQLDGLSS